MGEWWPYYRVGTNENPIYAYGSYGKNEFVTYTTDDVVGDWIENFYLNIRVKNAANVPLLGCSIFFSWVPRSVG